MLLRRLRSVRLREWPEVAAVASVAVAVELGLRVLTLPRLARLVGAPLRLETGQRPFPDRETDLRLPRKAVRRVRVAQRVMRHWPFGDTCLRRALVCGQRLRWLNPALRVGVAKIDGQVQAHAWLEMQNMSLDPGSAAFELLEPVHSTVDG